MNFSELFIRRPIMTTLVMAAILIFGIMGYRLLPVSDLPNVDFPTISVGAGLSGASPETMAAVVATPLEKQFSTIPGVDQMTSSSGQGNTNVTLQFNLSRSIDAAFQDAMTEGIIDKPATVRPPGYYKPTKKGKARRNDMVFQWQRAGKWKVGKDLIEITSNKLEPYNEGKDGKTEKPKA